MSSPDHPHFLRSSSGGQDVSAHAVLVVLCGVSFTSNAIISLVAPIVPLRFEVIGVSHIWQGLVFSMYPAAMLVSTPWAVRAMHCCGRISVLLFGLVMQGLACVAFGYADALTGGTGKNVSAAVTVYMLSRFACGAGSACANNAIFSVTTDRFPDCLGKIVGLNEVINGVAFTVGPPLGMWLYMRYSFETCFLLAGLSILVFTPVALSLWPAQRNFVQKEDEEGSLFDVLTKSLVVPAGSLLLGTTVFGLVEPLLALYLRDEVGANPSIIGLMFAIFALAYAVFGPVMGCIADEVGALEVCCIGCLSTGLTLVLLFGPLSGSMAKGSLARMAYQALALVLLGGTTAAQLIPSLSAMKDGVQDEPNSTERVVAWFNMAIQFGLAAGPVLGAVLSRPLGFEWTNLSCGVGITAYGAAAVAFAFRTAQPPQVERVYTSCSLIASPILTPRPSECDLLSDFAPSGAQTPRLDYGAVSA
mmetsp:Transcript_3640/g.10966  ORF Transcript_3640/g.10966 Transcript_3640/m.10966 type:complete len:474 (+) Transcript_3640:80-1501(+)